MSNLSISIVDDDGELLDIDPGKLLSIITEHLKSGSGNNTEVYDLYNSCISQSSIYKSSFFVGDLYYDLCRALYFKTVSVSFDIIKNADEAFKTREEFEKFIKDNFSIKLNLTEIVDKAEKYFSHVCFFCYAINSIIGKVYNNYEALGTISRVDSNAAHNICMIFTDKDKIPENKDIMVSFSLLVTPDNFNTSIKFLDDPIKIVMSRISNKNAPAVVDKYNKVLREINRNFLESILHMPQ